MSAMPTPPHLDDRTPLLRTRRGSFWIPGDVVEAGPVRFQSGPMFVEWEAPEQIAHPYPAVLVHGGGGQGTDWMSTPDGRAGWARLLVEAGYAVYVVDRVGHGRSPFHPDVLGPMGGPFPYEAGRMLFAHDDVASAQSAWTWDREPGGAEFDQLMAGMAPLPADLARSQQLDADRLAKVLDRIGPAILITHSAGGPVGWLTTDARPALVAAVVAVEPMGPAFAEFPGVGALSWGLTAAPITTEPSYGSAGEARAAGADALALPALKGKPVALVTGGASGFADFREQIVEVLERSGAHADRLHLPDRGIEGNGHGLIFEANSEEILGAVLAWLSSVENEEADR